jgi:hypothetical protein
MTHKKGKTGAGYNYNLDQQIQPPPFHSVELFIDGLEFTYQFKIWSIDSDTMNILIKEDSAIINRLKTGNRFNSKFYTDDRSYPMVELNTEISHITKAEEGRFKGHYIVGLSVENNPVEITMH